MSRRDKPPFTNDEDLLQLLLPFLLPPEAAHTTEAVTQVLTGDHYALLLYATRPTGRICDEAMDHLRSRLQQRHGVFCFQFRSHDMGLLPLGASAASLYPTITGMEADIEIFLDRLYQEKAVELNLSIGRPFRGLMNLRDPYSELINSPLVLQLRPGSRIVSEYDIKNAPSLLGAPYPQSEVERRLAEAVLSLEIPKAERILSDIIDYELSNLQLRLSFLPRMGHRLEWILLVLHIPRNSGDEKSADFYDYPYLVQYAEGNDHGLLLVHEFFQKLDDYYKAFRFNINKDISQITRFIRDNYSDLNLSATMICDRFRISSSYLSHLFKRRTGVKLVDYIHQVRIENAKRLLETTELSMQEISSQVGYTSSAGFATSFKKYEAITPREYRANFRINQQPL